MATITTGTLANPYNSSTSALGRTCKLSETTFAHTYIKTTSSGAVYCKIGTIDSSNNITYGNEYTVQTLSAVSARIERLTDTSFILVCIASSTVYATVCNVNSTVVTPATNYTIRTGASTDIRTSVYDSTRFIIAVSNSSSIYGYVCSISSDIITVGTVKIIVSNMSVGGAVDVVYLSPINVFFSFFNGSSGLIDGVVGSINNLTITIGTVVNSFNSNASSTAFKTERLTDTSFVIIDNSDCLKIIIIGSELNILTIGQNVSTRTTNYLSGVYLAAINETKFIMTYPKTNSLYGRLCVVDGTAITFSDEDLLLTTSVSVSNLSCDVTGNKVIFGVKQSLMTSVAGSFFLGKKINGVTVSKWNGIAISKYNGI